MKTITSRIKLIGLVLSLILSSLIAVTIYLNGQTKHDAYVVNIAGKERMLSQKMAKEIFLNLSRGTSDFRAFDAAKAEFASNLTALRRGDGGSRITPPPSEKIRLHLEGIEAMSREFFALSDTLRRHMLAGAKPSSEAIGHLYVLNNSLLELIDDTVRAYTVDSEEKITRLETIQYIGGFLTVLAVIGSIVLTWRIDREFFRFLASAKEVSAIHCDDSLEIEDEAAPAQHELQRAEADMTLFLKKVEKVLLKAQNALDESQEALTQIEGAAKVMDKQLKELSMDEPNRAEISRYIDRSEDLTINSLEEIAGTKKLLDRFQKTLDTIVRKMEPSQHA